VAVKEIERILERPLIGVIGGSGFYSMKGVKILEELRIDTPFGSPSSEYVLGSIGGNTVAFLARHGKGHRYRLSELNYKANIFGFKLLGVKWLISVSAVGSMKEEIEPGHIVVPNQFIDLTRKRDPSFFGHGGIVAHVSMADPVCPLLSSVLSREAKAAGAAVHEGGIYVCIEGPQFSTRAESNLYRSWGVSVIGMTNMPEVKLAREAEICYATLAMATDYDCWHETQEDVTAEKVIHTLKQNVEKAQEIVKRVVSQFPIERSCHCPNALKDAIITDPAVIPDETYQKLKPLISKYI